MLCLNRVRGFSQFTCFIIEGRSCLGGQRASVRECSFVTYTYPLNVVHSVWNSACFCSFLCFIGICFFQIPLKKL